MTVCNRSKLIPVLLAALAWPGVVAAQDAAGAADGRGTLLVVVTAQPSGAGIPGVPLRVTRIDSDGGSYGGDIGLTNENGEYRYLAMAAGRYRIDIHPGARKFFDADQPLESYLDHHLPAHLGDVSVHRGRETRFDFGATRGATLRGRLVDHDAKPLPEAALSSDEVSIGSSRVVCDSEGRFTMRGAPSASDIELTLQPKDCCYQRKLRIQAGRTQPGATLDLGDVVVPGKRGQDNILLTTVQPSGEPFLPLMNFRLVSADRRVHGLIPVRKGSASAELPPGRYTISNRGLFGGEPKRFELFEQQVTLSAGELTKVLVKVTPRTNLPKPAAPAPAPQSPPATPGSKTPQG